MFFFVLLLCSFVTQKFHRFPKNLESSQDATLRTPPIKGGRGELKEEDKFPAFALRIMQH
jgi:hypothetical protein